MNKGQRHIKIRELVTKYDIKTQEELADYLSKEGLQVTQATISRDIKELYLVKVALMEGGYKYSLPPNNQFNPMQRLRRLANDVLVGTSIANNLIVLKTLPGNAHAIGVLIDNMDWELILGTICGDDTILLICPSNEAAAEVIALYNEMIAK